MSNLSEEQKAALKHEKDVLAEKLIAMDIHPLHATQVYVSPPYGCVFVSHMGMDFAFMVHQDNVGFQQDGRKFIRSMDDDSNNNLMQRYCRVRYLLMPALYDKT